MGKICTSNKTYYALSACFVIGILLELRRKASLLVSNIPEQQDTVQGIHIPYVETCRKPLQKG